MIGSKFVFVCVEEFEEVLFDYVGVFFNGFFCWEDYEVFFGLVLQELVVYDVCVCLNCKFGYVFLFYFVYVQFVEEGFYFWWEVVEVFYMVGKVFYFWFGYEVKELFFVYDRVFVRCFFKGFQCFVFYFCYLFWFFVFFCEFFNLVFDDGFCIGYCYSFSYVFIFLNILVNFLWFIWLMSLLELVLMILLFFMM